MPRASSASSRRSSIRERRERLDAENRLDQERLRDLHAEKERKPLLPLERARENRHRVAFDDLPEPEFTGRREVEADLATLRDYIDWQFFFHAWELKGKFPQILDEPAARELWDDAQALLDKIVGDKLLQARGVFGFWPAHAEGDDVVVGDTRFCFLRQQTDYGDSRPNRSLADYVAPADDHVGAFAVTAGIGADELAAQFVAEHDDYHAIMVKALADRLAEAFAEYLHETARRAWYETGPKLSGEELLAERFRGIRPAFGYPACPDHTEKGKLFALLGAEDAEPRAHRDVRDDARRERQRALSSRIRRRGTSPSAASTATRSPTTQRARGSHVDEAERWLRPNLAYSPVGDDETEEKALASSSGS